MKKHKISKKAAYAMFAVLAVALASTLVSAALLTYFGKVQTTMDVAQSVQIDGQNWDQTIIHDLPDAQAGCCYCFEHEITNNGCEAIALDFTEWGEPDLEGIEVTYKQRCYLDELVIDVLDGIADDSFDVYVDGTLVYSYTNGDPINDPEVWHIHNIPLGQFMIPCYGTHTVKIDATGPAWDSWSTYGQLGVDNIELYCGVCHTLCDSVDIGNPTSEAGHNLQDWGPIEPATNGGNWGGINDCCATWTSSDQNTWATVDLTCEFCECDCEKPDMDLPFTLEPEETLQFCICYKLDMLLMPGQYTIHHKLVPATI